MWPWMASVLHWAPKEDSPAAAGAGGGRPVCGVPPQITLKWLLSMADRYSRSPYFNYVSPCKIELLELDFGFSIVVIILKT